MSDSATKDPGGTKDELREKLQECEETRERLEDENETLRESSETFGDLADRLARRLAGKRAHDGSTDS